MPRILVVEDDALNRKLMNLYLGKKGGYTVIFSEDAAEVISLTKAQEVDLIMMDVSLTNTQYEGKNIDGIELTRLLKDNPECAKIPIVIVTAHAMRGDKEKFLELGGADDYIAKPITDPEALLAKISELLQK